MEVGYVTGSGFVRHLVDLNERGEIIADGGRDAKRLRRRCFYKPGRRGYCDVLSLS